MVFSSVEFLFMLFPGTLGLYFLLSRLPDKMSRLRDPLLNVLLACASLLFYAWGEPILLILLLGSVFANWLFGLGIARSKDRILLAAAVVLNIGLLGVFKYAGFATEMLNAVTGLSLPVPRIALPIGISFYTFQALSYVIDVYRDPKLVQKSGFRLLLYISFFPQLIAGPIVRYGDIADQLKSRTITLDGAMLGFRRLFIGLGKKILIADELAVLVNVCFTDHAAGQLPWGAAWLGAIAYLLQIYFDFSGYSDMAIGMGRIFGFQFPENFNYPYASLGIKDFWRRWHITLSTWFREYLYIPLGGNRKGKKRMLLNQLIVFFCTGLWHGANLTFVVWGLYNGLFLILESNDILPVRRVKSAAGKILVRVYTLLVVTVGFVIFRADNLSQAWAYLGSMFTFGGAPFGWVERRLWSEVLPCLTPYFFTILAAAIVGAAPLTPWLKATCDARPRLNAVAQRLSYLWALLMLALCAMSLAAGTYSAFIYFQF